MFTELAPTDSLHNTLDPSRYSIFDAKENKQISFKGIEPNPLLFISTGSDLVVVFTDGSQGIIQNFDNRNPLEIYEIRFDDNLVIDNNIIASNDDGSVQEEANFEIFLYSNEDSSITHISSTDALLNIIDDLPVEVMETLLLEFFGYSLFREDVAIDQDNTEGVIIEDKLADLRSHFEEELGRLKERFEEDEERCTHLQKQMERSLANKAGLTSEDIFSDDGGGPGDLSVAHSAEILVTTETGDRQENADVTVLIGGGTVVVWESFNQDGSLGGIYAQQFDVNGAPAGSEFKVNTTTSSEQRDPSITALNNGGFVVVWESSNGDGDGYAIMGQRYNASGVIQGAEFQINTYTSSDQTDPTVGALSGGGFVVVWESTDQDGSSLGIYAQRYNNSGVTQGSEFQVNTYTTSVQDSANLIALNSGGFVVTWASFGQDGDGYGIYGQRYDTSGVAQGSEFQVNTYTSSNQLSPVGTGLNDGGFIIAYTSYGADGSDNGVFAQRYSVTGLALSNEFQVNSQSTNIQQTPSITTLNDGSFVITWEAYGQDESAYGIFGQLFDASGIARGSEFQLNTIGTGDQRDVAISATANGGFVAVWESLHVSGEGENVYMEHFDKDGNRVNATPTFTVSTTITDEGTPDVYNLDISTTTVSGTLNSILISNVPSTAMLSAGTDNGDGSWTLTTGQLSGLTITLASDVYFESVNLMVSAIGTNDNGNNVEIRDTASILHTQEGRVNTTTTDAQENSAVTVLADGNIVVTWESYNQDGSSDGIFAQRYDAGGNPQGGEFQINTATSSNQILPSITALTNGNFVVIWESALDTFGQRYDSSGVALGSEFLVNTHTASGQHSGHVTALSDGGFVVTWKSAWQDGYDYYDIYAQRYDSNGVAQGGEFHVNTYSTDEQSRPNAIGLKDGFVITWSSNGQDGSSYGTYGQRYDSAGVAQGSEFQVNSYTDSNQFESVGTGLSDGGFVVAWQSAWQDAGYYGIYAQRFDSSGVAQGSEFLVNTYTADAQQDPTITTLNDGSFVIAWESDRQDGDDYSIHAQIFDANGNKRGSEFQVNAITTDSQLNPSIAATQDGGFVVSWNSLHASGEAENIYMERFDSNGNKVNIETVFSIDASISATASFTAGADEHQVNTYTTLDQRSPATTTAADGTTVIVWESSGQDGDNYGIYGQRYDTSGKPLDGEFLVNTTTSSVQQNTDVTGLTGGGFVVTWESYANPGGNNYDIMAQIYDASGAAVGSEFITNSAHISNVQQGGRIAALTDEGFVVVWESWDQDGNRNGIFGQRFDANGNTNGAVFQANTYTNSDQENPDTFALSNGGFVVVWQSNGQDSSNRGIYGQRYDSNGDPQGDEFLVNTYIRSDQDNPVGAGLSGGEFIIAWESSYQEGSFEGVYAQRYDSNGNKAGSEFLVNTTTGNQQQDINIALLDDGSFIIAWESNLQDGSGYGIYTRHYDASGNSLTGEIAVTTITSGDQTNPSVTATDSGGYIISWDAANIDGSGQAVVLQRYDSSDNPISMAQGITFDLDINITSAPGATLDDITISGIPSDATLSAGTDNSNGTWTLTAGELSNLSLNLDSSATDSVELFVEANGSDSDSNPVEYRSGLWVDPGSAATGREGFMLDLEELNLGQADFNLAELLNLASDVSRINLNESGSTPTELESLTLTVTREDVLEISDDNNTLFIDGDSNDTVKYDSVNFNVDATNSVTGYTHYSDGAGAHLYVNEDINVMGM